MPTQNSENALKGWHIGERFGMLTVLRFVRRDHKKRNYVECICDCGNKTITNVGRLMYGHTKSCGCLQKTINLRHGGTHSRTYQIWAGMKGRCNNPNYNNYIHYGARGIKYAPEWEHFENFIRDMGEAPDGCSLDRIDVNGNYEPSNCRWATNLEQGANTRRTHNVEFRGETMCISEFARRIGASASLTWYYVNRGLPPEEIARKFNHG